MSVTEPGRRRRLDSSEDPIYDLPTRQPRLDSPGKARIIEYSVVLFWLIASAAAATSIISMGAPDWLWRPSAGVLLVFFAMMLTHRCGGHLRIWATLSAGLAISAQFGPNALVVAAAGTTAVLAAVSSVMLTRPAATALQVVREFIVSFIIVLSGTAAVAAWNAPVNVRAFSAYALAASVGLTIAIVWNLGAGLHGLNAQQVKILVGVAAVAVVLAVYGGFVRMYGSPAITEFVTSMVVWLRQNTGGVPRPLEVFIGFPAIIVGTAMRSRNREGWWVCVFAAIGASVISTSLVDPAAYPSYFAYSTLYSALIGLVIGFVLRQLVLAPRSARAARAVEPPRRVEPDRLAPLK